MRDKDKSSQKKNPGSKGSTGAKRAGSGNGSRRSCAAVPAGSSVQQTTTAQNTKQKRLEDARKESEECYRLLTELSPDMIAIHQEGRFMFINKAGLRMLGADRPEQLLGKLVLDVVHPDYRDIVRERVKHGIQEGIKAHFIEEAFLRFDGTEVPVEVTGLPFTYKGGPAMIVIAREITESKRSELALKQSEEKYRRLYNETPVLLHSIDRDARLVDVNDYWLKTMGYELNECIGRKVTDFYTDASRKYAQEVIQPAFFRDGTVKDISYQFIKKNGEVLDVLLSATAERDVSGNVLRSLAVIEDITERKRVAEALQKSERMLQTIIDTEPDCIKVIDEESRLIMMNRAGLNMIQADSLEQVRGQFVCPLVAPEYQKAFMDLTRQVFQGGSGSLEFRMVGMRGSQLSLETYAVPLRNEKDQIIALLGVTRDITERKQVEEKISAYSASLQRLLSVSREMTATTDITSLYRTAVQTAVDLLHFNFSTVMVLSDDRSTLTISDSIGFPTSMIDHFHLVEGQGLATYVVKNMMPEAVVDFRTETRFEVPAIVRDLNIRSALCVPMMLEDRVFGVLIGHTREQKEFSREDIAIYQSIGNQAAIAITNAMNVEALRKNEAALRNITSSIAEGLYVMNAEGRITYMNEEAERLLGWSVAELNERGVHQLVHFRKADGSPLPLDVCRMHGNITGRSRYISNDEVFVRKDGTVFPVSIVCSPIVEDGKAVASVIAFRDIAETKRLEQEMLKAQKLESIGTLAGGIAHDFNNLLQGVFGFISMARLTFDQKEKSLAMLAQAEKALHQSVNLTSQLLTFSKGGKPVKKVLALRPLIENSVKFALSGSRVTYEIVTDEDLRAVEADEGQIGQVIQNIVLNADQSMPLGGMIRVSVRNMHAAAITAPPADLQGDLVQISIRDQGTGIPADHLTRIFDPYFTTKEKGSGLGLATSYSIIKNHGGLVHVQSEVGKGTTFFIYIPASGAKGEETKRPAIPATTRKGRILVMDDEEMIRTVAGELLTAIGHEVAFAEKGETALEAYRAARDAGRPFDVVILDLTIRGGMGGMETMRKLADIDPDVRAVVSSGYSDDPALSDYLEEGFRAFLKKPYNMEELQSTLNALLA
jgi:two-component system, cell cycle sensor histidine kinase and response regulator CckA